MLIALLDIYIYMCCVRVRVHMLVRVITIKVALNISYIIS